VLSASIFFLLFGGFGLVFLALTLPWVVAVSVFPKTRWSGKLYFILVGAILVLVLACLISSLMPKPLFIEDRTFFGGVLIAAKRQGICFALAGSMFGASYWFLSERQIRASKMPGRMRRGYYVFLIASLCAFITAAITARKNAGLPIQRFTGYPPSVYLGSFLACVSDAPCVQTDKFHLDQVLTGCCVLMVTNGDGQGADEVRSYEVFLNGDRVIATDHSRNAQAAVKLRPINTLKIVLSGASHSKVFVLLADDPRRTK
jgi:hypothetical protein